MSNGGWYSESDIYDYAKVQAGASQDIYHDDTLTIKEIYVKSGDTVKIGDRLVAYDTTLAGLEQEKKQKMCIRVSFMGASSDCRKSGVSERRCEMAGADCL